MVNSTIYRDIYRRLFVSDIYRIYILNYLVGPLSIHIDSLVAALSDLYSLNPIHSDRLLPARYVSDLYRKLGLIGQCRYVADMYPFEVVRWIILCIIYN